MKQLRRKHLSLTSILAIVGIFIFFSIVSVSHLFACSNNNAEISYCDTFIVQKTHQVKDTINYMDSIDSLRKQLIFSVDSYMRNFYPKTKLSSEHIVDMCIKHDFDIPLLLSQALQESCFGKVTRGNSVFGVQKRRYSHVNESVDDYIRLMKKSYVRNRTPEECIAMNFNVEGSRKYRYAGDSNYGRTIKRHRTRIIRDTEIKDLHEKIMEYQDRLDSGNCPS